MAWYWIVLICIGSLIIGALITLYLVFGKYNK